MKNPTVFYFVGTSAFNAFDNGAFDEYAEAIDFQNNINDRMAGLGKAPNWFLYEANLSAHNLQIVL